MRGTIEAEGKKFAFVFMEPESRAATFFAQYGMADALRFSDPKQTLYGAFELGHSSFLGMFRPATIWRFITAMFAGFGVGMSKTDMQQMPGSFLFHKGKILKSYLHKNVSDRPDYCELART